MSHQRTGPTRARAVFRRVCRKPLRALGLWALATCGFLLLPRAAWAQAAPTAADAAAARSDSAEPTFDIFEFVVVGNSVLAVEDIERAVYPFLGEKRVIADVEAARSALERVYHERGYGSSGVDIPEQRVAGGVVTLKVVEARIVRTRVTGASYFSQGYILEKVGAGAAGEVPHFPTLQAQLGAVNRTADRRVTPLLRPGKEPGTTELDLAVEDHLPLHGSVELSNRASPNTSQTRLAASLRYDNLFQRDHSLALQAQASPERTGEVKVFSATYTAPMGEIGQDSLLASYTRSNSNVAAGIGGTNVLGKGQIWGLRRGFTLGLKEREYHVLTLSADYKDYDETVDFGEGQGFNTPITYLPLGVSLLSLVDDDQGRWQIGASLSLGLNGIVNRQSEFASKRFDGRADYALLKLDLGREQKLPWNGLSLKVDLGVQIAGQPLISNEQFVVGGVDSVRGYLESAAAGDQGVRASIELRSAELAAADSGWLRSLRAHLFVDGAATWLHDPLKNADGSLQDHRAGLLGTGFGLRLAARPAGSLALDFAWALHPLGNTRRGDFRLHASGGVEF